MFEAIIYLILIWFAIGLIAAILTGFVYFRGMQHMIECHIRDNDERKKLLGMLLLRSYIASPSTFTIIYLIVSMCCGIFTLINLIKDFYHFTINQK